MHGMGVDDVDVHDVYMRDLVMLTAAMDSMDKHYVGEQNAAAMWSRNKRFFSGKIITIMLTF